MSAYAAASGSGRLRPAPSRRPGVDRNRAVNGGRSSLVQSEHRELEIAIVVGAHPPEATALEEPHRGGVAHEWVGVEGSDLLAPQELSQRRGPDAAAPEPLPEPVADEAPTVLPTRDDVAGDLS